MPFQSIDDIVSSFDLKSTDKEFIRNELNQRRVAIHPDKNGGQFKSREEENLYSSINEAIEFIDNSNNSQLLIPAKEVTDLIKAVTQLIPNNKTNYIEQEIRDQISSSLVNYSRQLLAPRLGLTAVTAIVSFVFLFPKTVSEHPILKKLLDGKESIFSLTWLFIMAYTIAYWYITFSREERLKRILSNLKTENLQNRIFEEFFKSEISFRSRYSNTSNNSNVFSKSDLIQFIRHYFDNRHIGYSSMRRALEMISILWPSRSIIIDADLAESVAQSIVTRAEGKNIIIKKNLKTQMSDFYEIVESIS